MESRIGILERRLNHAERRFRMMGGLALAAVAGALLVGAYLVMNRETHFLGIKMTSQPLEPETLLQLYALLAAISDPVRKLSSTVTACPSARRRSTR